MTTLEIAKSSGIELKNTNIMMYASNPQYNQYCAICCCTRKLLVNHYVKEHPEKEVYISRISAEMRTRMDNGLINSVYGRTERLVTTVCPFCDIDSTKNISSWVEHLTVHTGEYLFECTRCNFALAQKGSHEKKPECAKYIRLKSAITVTDAGIKGFICNNCNYVQINEQAVKQHIREQHKRAADAASYSSIMLLKMPKHGNNLAYQPRIVAETSKEEQIFGRQPMDTASGTGMARPIIPIHEPINCPICKLAFVFDQSQWVKHLAIHTKEYYYRCLGCGLKVGRKHEHLAKPCGGRTSDQPENITVDTHQFGIYGYSCKLCSVIYLARGRVIHHIHTFHGIRDITDEPIHRINLITLRK